MINVFNQKVYTDDNDIQITDVDDGGNNVDYGCYLKRKKKQ